MRTIWWALTVVALGAMFSTLVGFLGGVSWVFDFAANLRVHQAAVLAVLAVVFAVARRWVVAALCVAATLLNVVVVAPYLGGDAPPPAPDASELSISFLNVRIRGAEQAAVVDYLRGRDDDLVILVAGTRSWVAALEEADLDLHVVAGPRRGLDLEIIVLASDPDLDVVVHRAADDSRSSLVEVVVHLDGRPVHVLATHPVSPQTPARAVRRDHHLAWVREWAVVRTPPVVVVGDLNATPWSAPIRSLMGEGGLVDSQRGHGLQPSWPAALGPFGIAIDHVLHSPELTTVERRLGPSFGSSHRMVHVRLAGASQA